jgi:L-asparaginase II
LANPVLVELTRGDLVESFHRGAIAIARTDGSVVFSIGDIEKPVYSRSSLKPIQALPLVESGAADAFGLSDEELALACASHSGEPMHTTRVAAWLKRIGCEESDLACGAHASRYEPVTEDMIRRGEKPTRICNNCSGKHTGFLTVCKHWNVATKGYEHIDHPVQQAVAKALTELSGEADLPWGIDGCTAPNFAIPLAAFARAMAQFADPRNLPVPRAQAAGRLYAAMVKHPELVSGTGRPCATLMRAGGGAFAVKTGAEGFFMAIVPQTGLGIALKIDDGAGRASETAIAALLHKLGLLGDDKAALALEREPLKNTRGEIVGERRPAPELQDISLDSLRG